MVTKLRWSLDNLEIVQHCNNKINLLKQYHHHADIEMDPSPDNADNASEILRSSPGHCTQVTSSNFAQYISKC